MRAPLLRGYPPSCVAWRSGRPAPRGDPEGWPGLEIGWKLARAAWGRGYATEAARAAMEWAWAELAAEELISVIQPDNGPSIRVAERLGLERRHETTVGGRRVRMFAIRRPPPSGT